MCKALRTAVLVIPMLAGSALPSEAQLFSEPLALRNYRLGTSLAEFRQLPYSDAKEMDARAVCTGDPFAEENKLVEQLNSGLSEEETKAGVKACRYFYRSRGDQAETETWKEAGVAVGDLGRQPTIFYFTPKTDDPTFSERLFRIILTFNYRQSDRLMSIYMTEIGPPDVMEIGGGADDTGAIYDSVDSSWHTDTSELKMSNRFSQESGSATYTETELALRLNAYEQAQHDASRKP